MAASIILCDGACAQINSFRVLNYQGDNGFMFEPKDEASEWVRGLGERNGGEVLTNVDATVLNPTDLFTFDLVDPMIELLVTDGLILDLDADVGIQIEDGNRITSWTNQVGYKNLREFVIQNEGRKIPGSGRPRLRMNVAQLNGHNSVVFHRQELVNHSEDATDHLITGSGYTWFSLMAVYKQVPGLKDVNSFFGNLRNSGKYEGIWGNFTDDNRPWIGSRNGITFGRWDENNPMVLWEKPLEVGRYYLVIGRMDDGSGTVNIELFVNAMEPVVVMPILVNEKANSSKLAIGQERDAIQHPGVESFDGEIARFLIYERPLSNSEMEKMIDYLKSRYNIKQ